MKTEITETLANALRKLAFSAQTSGGTAGPDKILMFDIDQAAKALKQYEDFKNQPPTAQQATSKSLSDILNEIGKREGCENWHHLYGNLSGGDHDEYIKEAGIIFASQFQHPQDSSSGEVVKCKGNCGMNYCDENGCVESKQHLSEPIPPASESLEQVVKRVTEIVLSAPSRIDAYEKLRPYLSEWQSTQQQKPLVVLPDEHPGAQFPTPHDEGYTDGWNACLKEIKSKLSAANGVDPVEMTTCECGNVHPLEYSTISDESNTCPKCQIEYLTNEHLVVFLDWYEKLSPANKCTVHSEHGTGLFNKTHKQIVKSYMEQSQQQNKGK